jgi:hypothetical protein
MYRVFKIFPVITSVYKFPYYYSTILVARQEGIPLTGLPLTEGAVMYIMNRVAITRLVVKLGFIGGEYDGGTSCKKFPRTPSRTFKKYI